MSTTEHQTRIEEIVWCEGQAEEMLRDAAETARDADILRWRAAKLITEELESGRTQREVAEEIGKSQRHVNHMAQANKIISDNHGCQGRSFDYYYQGVKKKTKIAVDTHGYQERSLPPAPRGRTPMGALTSCERKANPETSPLMSGLRNVEDTFAGVFYHYRKLLENEEVDPRTVDYYTERIQAVLDAQARKFKRTRK